ncbi:MAG: hypothetical protein HC933_10320 [Pleurocapsa sp. SU_196_0]|nr:hypothetical protein [Pleurocapsa sp. SU_196_0]
MNQDRVQMRQAQSDPTLLRFQAVIAKQQTRLGQLETELCVAQADLENATMYAKQLEETVELHERDRTAQERRIAELEDMLSAARAQITKWGSHTIAPLEGVPVPSVDGAGLLERMRMTRRSGRASRCNPRTRRRARGAS